MITIKTVSKSDKKKLYQKKYRDSHKDELKATQKRYRDRLKEKGGQYKMYIESMTPERLAEYKAKKKEYRRVNSEKIRAKQSELYRAKAEKYVLTNLLGKAARDGLPFNITEEDIKTPEFCPVLGIRLERGVGVGKRGNRIDNSPSVDRIIPELGYVRGNVVVVSYRANRIKNDATIEELKLVADFYQKLQEGVC